MDRGRRNIQRMRPSHRASRRLPPPHDPSKCIKCSLFSMNIIFWVVGTLILCIGIYIIIELKDFIKSFNDLFYQPAVIFVVLGSLVFIITFFGCVGALRENTCFLAFYAGCLAMILILLLTGGVMGYLYRGPLEKAIDSKLRNAIILYRDEKKQDLHFLIDASQTALACCGIRSYKDWQLNVYFNCQSPAPERCAVPYSCCKKQLQFNRQCGYGVDKLSNTKRQGTINTVGCLTQGISWIQTNVYLLTGLSSVLLVVILMSIFMSLSFRKQILAIKKYAEQNTKRGSFNPTY